MDLTGIGLYTLGEAERLTGAPSREVSRWLFGYSFKDGKSPPLWKTQLSELDEKVIGFRDLMELRIVKAFRMHDISLRVIRTAIENAREIFAIDYPFSANRFLTDGKSIFYEALKEHGEVELTDVVRRQIVFEHIVRPELYMGIEFTADGRAKRWHPLKSSNIIVLDPDIAFGKPILADYGVRTDTVADAYRTEKSKKRVASLYGIPVSAVEAAIRYERLAA
ncbi:MULTISPECIES: DUF433 domain-containing protein [Ralstonia solanacearum species complex]|uniref:DUF433 domain-containing protein n=2 Tax=Ralstonia solanacearum TaxID=305 RepID=A0ABF7R8U4_RALSL|nr:DUF433 domain-containing protein [Ralstonia solanacearum]ALF89508.1 hypothetical protein RSUY_31960 [Ralstonia solanacearum]ATI28885.1 DUF433 domain-containing protein [Ralstonia solanacearum]ATJ87620.1 DUF433 domain-containing protein [Ralstonia solanacearum]EAP71859.1 Hypothetical Protein RRSL_02032 [Ralstonia solanacearum UW551]KEI31897.1 hypothetical protein CQ06_19990 [Ralstonia solanacearum]